MGSQWKILILFLLNAGMSLCISNLVFEYKFPKVKNLKVEGITADYLDAKYVSIRSEQCGEAGAITLQAGGDFAGINVTDGKKFATMWCDRRGPLFDTKE